MPTAVNPTACVLNVSIAGCVPDGLLYHRIVSGPIAVKSGTGKPKHTSPLVTVGATGVGKIVTVKIIGVPAQPLREGVTVIVPVIFTPVLLAGAIHEAILLAPLATRPILIFELVQPKVAPVGALTKGPILI